MKKLILLTVCLALLSCKKGPASPSATDLPVANEHPTLSGTIRVDPKLSNKLHHTVFIIVKKESGPPLAVKRILHATFPLRYEITAADMMVPNIPFTGEVTIMVRVDKDGKAGPAQPGDLEGRTEQPVLIGKKEADILVTRIY